MPRYSHQMQCYQECTALHLRKSPAYSSLDAGPRNCLSGEFPGSLLFGTNHNLGQAQAMFLVSACRNATEVTSLLSTPVDTLPMLTPSILKGRKQIHEDLQSQADASVLPIGGDLCERVPFSFGGGVEQ